MIIDFHIHYCPEEFIRPKLGPGDAVRTVFTPDGKAGDCAVALRFQLDKFIDVMDQAGVDVAVFSSGEGMREDLDKCRVVNDRLKDAEEKYPGRFKSMAHVPPLGGAEAFAELKRCREELGFRGVAMHSIVRGVNLDEKALWPFYEKVNELGMYLFVHPGSAAYDSYLDYDLGRSVGREGHLMTVVVRLVNGGVMDDFPDMKIVFSHLGGGFSMWMPRILGYQDKQFWGTAGHPRHGKLAKRPFREYVEKMLFDTGGIWGDINPVKAALLELSPKNLVFGTDYPLEIREGGTLKSFVNKFRELPLTRQEIDGILGENGRSLIGV